MSKRVEEWMSSIEEAMRISVKKHIKNGILRFSNQPIEEWILDYPQQVSISVLHMILSQEINDILSHADYESIDHREPGQIVMHFHEEKVTIGNPDPSIAKFLDQKGNDPSVTGSIDETNQKSHTEQKTSSSRVMRPPQRDRTSQG